MPKSVALNPLKRLAADVPLTLMQRLRVKFIELNLTMQDAIVRAMLEQYQIELTPEEADILKLEESEDESRDEIIPAV